MEAAMSISSVLSNYLQTRGAHYDLCAHPHSRTSAETARLAHVPERMLAKSVVLEDDDGCVMAVVPADCRVHVSALARTQPHAADRFQESRRGTVVKRLRGSLRREAKLDRDGVALAGTDPSAVRTEGKPLLVVLRNHLLED